MNKRLNEIDTRLNTVEEEILESISSSCEKKTDEMNKNLERKFNQILNKKLDDKIVEEVVLDSKVLNSDDNDVNYNSEVSRSENYDNISEDMMLENNGVNIESPDEVVECNNGMLMCVYESERKWKDSIEVEGWQRVNFPQVYCEPTCLQMFLKGKSPLLENSVFSSCSLSFGDVPGKARRCFYVVVPSAWNDRK